MRVFSEPGVLVAKVFLEPGVLNDLEGIGGVWLVIFSAICFGTNPIENQWAMRRAQISQASSNPVHEFFIQGLLLLRLKWWLANPLPLYRIEILKKMIRKAALPKLAAMKKSVKNAAWALIPSNHH